MDLPKSTLQLLDDDNYENWKTRMLAGLTIKGLKHTVIGDFEVDEEDDDKARSYLILSCKDHFLPSIKGLETARAVWDRLESIHQAMSRAKVIAVRRQLAGLKKSSKESVSRYISRAETLRDQLLAAGGTLDSLDLITSILAGLPKEYDTSVQILESSTDRLTLPDIHSKLLVAEQRLQRGRGESEADATALAAANPSPMSNPHAAAGGKTPSKGRTCFYCGKPGHIAKDCRKKKRDQSAGSGGGSANAVALHAGNAYMAFPDLDGQPVWLVDSGATDHMTGDFELLDDPIPVAGPAIRFADGALRSATFRGKVHLDCEKGAMYLEDVLFVPGCKVNLISVSLLVDRGASVSPITRRGFKIRKCGAELQAVPRQGLYTVCGLPRLIQDAEEEECMAGEAPAAAAVATAAATTPHVSLGHATPAGATASDTGADTGGADGGTGAGGPISADSSGAACTAEQELWHARFCHLGPQNLSKLISKDMVTGLNLQDVDKGSFCEPCVLAKQHRDPFAVSKTAPTAGLIHMDVCGPFTPMSNGGNLYFLTALEDSSNYSLVFPLKSKDQAAGALKDAVSFFEKQGEISVKVIRTDRGGEFCATSLEGWMRSKGILHQKTAPYSPQSNGGAERLNRTLVEKLRAVLCASGAPKKYWAEALSHCNMVRNYSPVTGADKTPHELLFGTKPDVSHLRVWGCRAYPLIPSIKRRKLDDTSEMGVFMGMEANSKAYRVLLSNGSLRICREVKFREMVFPFRLAATSPTPAVSDKVEELDLELPDAVQMDIDSDGSSHMQADLELASDAEIDMGDPMQDDEPEPVGACQDPVSGPDEPLPDVRRSSRDRRQPGEWWAAAAVELQPDPLTLEEALGSDEAPMWKHAIQEEYDALISNKTWALETLPPGKRKLPVKWVFKRKRDAAGNIERYKARLVVLGCRQKAGVDYTEIYAPVGTVSSFLPRQSLHDMREHCPLARRGMCMTF